METLKNRLRINVGFIINATVGYTREFDFEFAQYKDDDLSLNLVRGEITISRAAQGLLAEGNFEANTPLECVKCLTEYQQAVQWQFSEFFAFKEENITESGLLVPDDAQIDFKELFREFAILEFPIRPVCMADCKGLCIECGINLNQSDCGHRQGPSGPLSELRNIIGN